MALPIKRLRWVLAAGALLLIVVAGGYIGYGRYRALLIYTGLLKRTGAHISHDTNGFTYSQTEKGRTVYTLHAATVTQLGDGKYDFHGVEITLYGRVPGRADRIFGNEFNYDEKQGIVRAIGEVHIDLQVPQSLAAAGHAQGAAAPARPNPKPEPKPDPKSESKHEAETVIHVRTSGLVYLRQLGVAATDQPVEFHYGGLECTALGAEFNSSQSTLRLLANVVANGLLRGQPVTLTATHAEVDRIANVATLAMPRAVALGNGGERTGRADQAVLDLRTDGSLQSARATGHVLFTGRTQQLSAAQLDATFNSDEAPQTVPQSARFSGGVQLVDSAPLRPVHSSAAVADLLFDAHGQISSITANGQAKFSMTDRRDEARGLLREMHGDRIIALFASSSAQKGGRQTSQLSRLHITGSASARGESMASPTHRTPGQPQIKTTILSGDDLQLTLTAGAKGQPEPRHLTVEGHTLLTQEAPLGERETSAGDTLNAEFAPTTVGERSPMKLVSALQTGHVVVHRTAPLQVKPSGPTQEVASGTAERVAYDGIAERLTLSGNAHLTQDNTSLTASTVTLDERTQDADASGGVQAVLVDAASTTQPVATQNLAKSSRPTHVLSASAHFNHETKQAEFHGTDAQPAKIWQDASQVQAATLVLDSLHHTFSARPAAPNALIHAVFAAAPATHPATHGGYVRVAAARMDYSEQQREAVFVGAPSANPQAAQSVVLEGDAGTIHAARAVAYLQPVPAGFAPAVQTASPTPVGGSLQRVVITGDVELDQPGRHGTGDELVYTTATGDSVLTGSIGRLPHIVDAQQGSITGPRLLFGDSGSTIIVSGESNTLRPGRVHTETQMEESKSGKGTVGAPRKSKK